MNQETIMKLREIVRKNYDEIAEDFNETRKKEIWPQLAKYAEMVKEGDSVLDAGCGNGRLLKAFRLKRVRYVGLDSNKKFIDYAQKSWVVPDGKFVFGDILDIKDNKEIESGFDFIFCIAVLHNIPGREKRIEALEGLKGRLGDGGRIVFSVWNLWKRWRYLKHVMKFTALKIIGLNNMEFGDILFYWGGNKKTMRYYHAFTMSETIKLAQDAGFIVEDFLDDGFNYYIVARKK